MDDRTLRKLAYERNQPRVNQTPARIMYDPRRGSESPDRPVRAGQIELRCRGVGRQHPGHKASIEIAGNELGVLEDPAQKRDIGARAFYNQLA